MSESESMASSDDSGYESYSDEEETESYVTTETTLQEERRQYTAQKWHDRIKQHYRHRKFIEPQRAEGEQQRGGDDEQGDLIQAVLALPGALVGAIPYGEDGRTTKTAPSGESELAEDGEVEVVKAQDVQAAMKRELADKEGAPVFSRRYIVYETKFVGPDFGVESEHDRRRREAEEAAKNDSSFLESLGGLASSVANAVGVGQGRDGPDSTSVPPLVPPGRPPFPVDRDTTDSMATSLFGKGLEVEMPKEKPKGERLCVRQPPSFAAYGAVPSPPSRAPRPSPSACRAPSTMAGCGRTGPT